jgi:hypothetical protein
MCFWAGCSRQDPYAAQSGSGNPAGSRSPLDVARALRSLHQQRRYLPLARLVVPEQRTLLVDTLMALDRLFEANERAKRAVISMHGEMVATEFDLGGLADEIGLFSRYVELSGERLDGDRATVLAQVSGRIPLDEFRFVRRDGRWLYSPQAPIPSLPRIVRELAAGIEMFAAQLERGGLSVEQIRSEFYHRVFRRVREIREQLPSSRPTAKAASTRP